MFYFGCFLLQARVYVVSLGDWGHARVPLDMSLGRHLAPCLTHIEVAPGPSVVHIMRCVDGEDANRPAAAEAASWKEWVVGGEKREEGCSQGKRTCNYHRLYGNEEKIRWPLQTSGRSITAARECICLGMPWYCLRCQSRLSMARFLTCTPMGVKMQGTESGHRK